MTTTIQISCQGCWKIKALGISTRKKYTCWSTATMESDRAAARRLFDEYRRLVAEWAVGDRSEPMPDFPDEVVYEYEEFLPSHDIEVCPNCGKHWQFGPLHEDRREYEKMVQNSKPEPVTYVFKP